MLMDVPQIRPGKVSDAEPVMRLVVFFANGAQGNVVIQLLGQLGIRMDRLGVTPPEGLDGGRGMVLSIPCPDPTTLARAETLCRSQGGVLHHQPV